MSPNGRFFKVISKKFDHLLSRSAFKSVFRAFDSQQGCEVAWISLKLENLAPREIIKLSSSIENNSQLAHKNIVSVNCSWVNKAKFECVIITEIVTGGSLKEYLRCLPQARLKLIKNWCRGILSGLQYLHSRSPQVIHGDLCTSNIHIMSGDGTIKINDFYLNKLFKPTSWIQSNPEYVAPEVFQGLNNEKSDIYSFGMALLEMCTQVTPYRECKNTQQVYNSVKNGVLPSSLNNIKDPHISNLIKLCLLDHTLRPSAEELLLHEFFDLNENPKNSLPVHLNNPHSRSPARKKRHVKTLSLILRDSNNDAKSVSFDFNPDFDTPEKVAVEMIESFNLDKSSLFKVAKEIEKKLESVKANELNIRIFKCKADEFEPNTSIVEHSKLPGMQYSSSVEDHIQENGERMRNVRRILGFIFKEDLMESACILKYIKKFQESEGIKPDGIVNDKLYKLLTQKSKKL